MNKSYNSNLAFDFIDAFLLSAFFIFIFLGEESFVALDFEDFELSVSPLSDLVAKCSVLVNESRSGDDRPPFL